MSNIGILAYGSLIHTPGDEIAPRIKSRLKVRTPFPVEYGRYSNSRKRGGAPTVVPHDQGAPVDAEILVLDENLSLQEARNMLWRREANQEGSGKVYPAGRTPNSIVVRIWKGSPTLECTLYTDFHPQGKQCRVTAEDLARQAIASVSKADPGKDGITYLRDNIAAGIRTPLTDAYRDEILKQTQSTGLDEALEKLRDKR